MLFSTITALFAALPALAQTGGMDPNHHHVEPYNEKHSAKVTWPAKATDYWALNGTAAVAWDYVGPSNASTDMLFLLKPLQNAENPEPDSTAWFLLDHSVNATLKSTTISPLKYAMNHTVQPGKYELWATFRYGAVGSAPKIECTTAAGILNDARTSGVMKGRECYVFYVGKPTVFEIKDAAPDMPAIANIQATGTASGARALTASAGLVLAAAAGVAVLV